MNISNLVVSVDDTASVFGTCSLGKVKKNSGSRLVIVAENKNLRDYDVVVEAVASFNSDNTAVELEFWLFIEPRGGGPGGNRKRQHAVLKPGVVEQALAQKKDVIAVAVTSEINWLRSDFPDISSQIEEACLQRTTPDAKNTGSGSPWI